ncbi:hypothetical protein DNTS_003825 [Danionella cerebrum]|uniref:Arrestin C-terminal-like domain-containing protein n=1 Tax=Danionella cerebrum TaxID=2873325 RepID=A0A553RK83_9TELE|nr:hypothetical protein DNTS_003825 [Danionella translucida]
MYNKPIVFFIIKMNLTDLIFISTHTLFVFTGESIQIFAEIENCSSRMVVPKAAIYQTQTFFAKGKMKEIKQLVANIRGESLSSGKTETWNGKMLKIPPVSPSILDCSIIRVEYSLMVYVDIPGAMNLSLNLPLVIGTIPLHPFGSRTSSVSSQCSMSMSWLGMGLPERPEAPPAYAEVVTDEQRQTCLEVLPGPIDPHPDQGTSVGEQRLDSCPDCSLCCHHRGKKNPRLGKTPKKVCRKSLAHHPTQRFSPHGWDRSPSD